MIRLVLAQSIVALSCLAGGCTSSTSPLQLRLEFGEADVRGTPTLTTFQPRIAGKPVHVKLVMTDAYPFEIDAPRYELFVPECKLTVLKGNDGQAIMAQTTTIDLVNQPFFKTAPLSEEDKRRYKKGYSRGSTGHMTLEFIPADTDTYRIQFKGPDKGFKRYELHVEQQSP